MRPKSESLQSLVPGFQVNIPQGNAALVQIQAELVQAEVLLKEVTQVVL